MQLHAVAALVVTITGCAGSRVTTPRSEPPTSTSPMATDPPPPAASGTASPTTVPAATTAATRTPCLDGDRPLEAHAIYQRFERQSWASMAGPDEVVPPAEPFGTCTVDRGVIRAADGKVVAELGCGVRILSTGIRDELGLQLGASGADVVDLMPRPRPRLRCRGNGPGTTWCRYERPDGGDTDGTSYVLDGELGNEVVVGEAAERWMASRRVVEIWYSVWCH